MPADTQFVAFYYLHSAHRAVSGLSHYAPRSVDDRALVLEPVSVIACKIRLLPAYKATKGDTMHTDGFLVATLLD